MTFSLTVNMHVYLSVFAQLSDNVCISTICVDATLLYYDKFQPRSLKDEHANEMSIGFFIGCVWANSLLCSPFPPIVFKLICSHWLHFDKCYSVSPRGVYSRDLAGRDYQCMMHVLSHLIRYKLSFLQKCESRYMSNRVMGPLGRPIGQHFHPVICCVSHVPN